MPRGIGNDRGRYTSGRALALARASSRLNPELKIYNKNFNRTLIPSVPTYSLSVAAPVNTYYPLQYIHVGPSRSQRQGNKIHIAKIWFRFVFAAAAETGTPVSTDTTLRLMIFSSPTHLLEDPTGSMTAFAESQQVHIHEDELFNLNKNSTGNKYKNSKVFSLRKKNFVVMYTDDAGGIVFKNAINVFCKHDGAACGTPHCPTWQVSMRMLYYDN